MAKRTLIINGSPRPKGNTATLIDEMRKTLTGEVVEVSAFRNKIAPCVDCRKCATTAKCAVRDDMDLIYADDFDNVVIATPIWFGTMPGPMMNLLSRFQPQHAAMFFLDIPRNISPKKAGLIMTAGSRKNAAGANHHIRCLFDMLNARGYEGYEVISDFTDEIPADQDEQALAAARRLGTYLSEDWPEGTELPDTWERKRAALKKNYEAEKEKRGLAANMTPLPGPPAAALSPGMPREGFLNCALQRLGSVVSCAHLALAEYLPFPKRHAAAAPCLRRGAGMMLSGRILPDERQA